MHVQMLRNTRTRSFAEIQTEVHSARVVHLAKAPFYALHGLHHLLRDRPLAGPASESVC